ncbi:MAG: sulfatase [Planctomycetaceae bacterium]|nr:sulfatase [Planctomycetaceae bacterium]
MRCSLMLRCQKRADRVGKVSLSQMMLLCGLLFVNPLQMSTCSAEQKLPNILWITIEDWSPDLSCYGTRGIHTPNLDQLAAEGIRYTQAFTTSPVCSTSRSALMTGFHQNYIGAEQHRETNKKPLPHGIRPIPLLLAEAGYFTVLMSNKIDCNFLPDTRQELFMGRDWSERNPDQPFFARISFQETHRPWHRDPERPIDIGDVEVPPCYADTAFVRRDWANGLESMQIVDRRIGQLLQRLDSEGIRDNTLVIFISDHGCCQIRGKQFLYDEGIHIPLIMRWPGKIPPGQVCNDLVSAIDLCATVLDAAHVQAPVPLQGISLFSEKLKEREFIFAARDKMGTTHDAMRAIRSREHKLILNLMPERPWLQFSAYKEMSYPVLAEMNVLYLQGKLTPDQQKFFAPQKPPLELFDLHKDPFELHNLAEDSAYSEVRENLLMHLQEWRENVIRDRGVLEDFRALHVFPETCPAESVDEWTHANVNQYDIEKHGAPGWYPTRSLKDWMRIREQWEPYVFREPDSTMKRPMVTLPYLKLPSSRE